MKNKFIGVLLLLILCFKVHAQEVLTHQKKIYVSPEEKIFFNKALPVYFFISASSDPNAPHYLVKSETTPKYANPMYFDTEGRNTLRSPSAVDTITKKQILPKIDVQFQVYVDSKPPSTQLLFDRAAGFGKKGIHYISDSLSVKFHVSDELSGVENTYVSLDGSGYKPASGALKLDEEKEFAIKYYSVDNTGNVEKMKELKFYIDKTPPTSELEISGKKFENVLSGNSSLIIRAEDKISGVKHIYFSVDDSVFHPYISKINTLLLTQGDHKLFYYATDMVNNKGAVITYNFYVDKTPPQVIEEILGKTFIANGKEFSAGTSKLKITAFDNKAGVKEIYYSINNAAFIKYEKPVLLTGYKGDIAVRSYATDNVDNKSMGDIANPRKNGLAYLDMSAPWVGHAFTGPSFKYRDTTFISNRTSVVLEAKDDESGVQKIECQIDSGDLMKYTEPITLSKEGYHRIIMYGYDNTENLTKQEFSVMVDTTGPEIFERFSSLSNGSIDIDGKKLVQYSGSVVVFLSATDALCGFENMSFELNDKPVQPYMRDVRGFIPGKKNTIKVMALDKLGNKTEKLIEFYLR